MKREIEEAIRMAVIEASQDESLSRRLVAWFDEVSSGNEMLTDEGATDRRLERLYKDTILPEDVKRARIDAVLNDELKKEVLELLGGRAASEPTGEDESGRPANGQSSS